MKKPSLAILVSAAIAVSGLSSATQAVDLSFNVEEARILKAQQTMPEVTARYAGLVDGLASKYQSHNDELKITQMVASQGVRLWQQAVRDVQSGNNDDRSLYWSRLAMRALIKQNRPGFNIVPWQKDILIKAVESASRGLSDIAFSEQAQIKILLTGFDPFFLDRNIEQSNPSGLVALALDGYRFKVNGKRVQVETAMIPVRYSDFDNGIIESMLTPIYRDNSVDMIATVSMGRDAFDLERFPGRNRSASAPDNLNHYTGASMTLPKAPGFNGTTLKGPEFVEFSLPVAAMQAVKGEWAVNDNRTITTLSRGEFDASSLGELDSAISVQGSGGGYLSNEISYRSVLLQQQFNSRIPVGHIHTPRVKGFDPEVEAKIVDQVKAMLMAAAQTL
ncbi:hypothetical protein [Shewanella gelidii]|uniref:Pyrrolidone-carboxylate peptidase n=1 Tax=Shewanella gelidii TaxID=1642821 RepID=A0A917JNQ7_9GAMM|nr:hypothetical protein [Shewanella gelidii]MCL1097854.1 hypothetical protein [Shewanella gelidii]GGI78233.1 hypothetical protein GCM10009332_14520 [Shewanella gelidii]